MELVPMVFFLVQNSEKKHAGPYFKANFPTAYFCETETLTRGALPLMSNSRRKK